MGTTLCLRDSHFLLCQAELSSGEWYPIPPHPPNPDSFKNDAHLLTVICRPCVKHLAHFIPYNPHFRSEETTSETFSTSPRFAQQINSEMIQFRSLYCNHCLGQLLLTGVESTRLQKKKGVRYQNRFLFLLNEGRKVTCVGYVSQALEH